MKKVITIIGFIGASLLLTSCVHHLSQQECMTTNWQQMGFGDGEAGRTPRNLDQAIKDCMKFQITVDPNTYMKGYRSGLQRFCTPTYDEGLNDGQVGKPMSVVLGRQGLCQQFNVPFSTAKYQPGYQKGLQTFCTYSNGENIGASGKEAPNVCSGNLAERFNSGWRKGRDQFCNNATNGFALGKSGAPYPAMCAGDRFLAFNSEFQRGQMVANRVSDLQGQIDHINRRINHLADKYNLRQRSDGSYRLGDNKSPQAKDALNEIRHLQRQLNRLQDQQYQAKTTAS